MRIAVVGEATAQELKKYYLEVDVMPEISDGEHLAEKILEHHNIENLNVLTSDKIDSGK